MATQMIKNLTEYSNEKHIDDSGCRSCCSLPHGINSLLTAGLATLAWLFAFVAVTNCHFLTPDYLYCHPPPDPEPRYGSCGDCHCINLDKPCPNGPGEMPLTEFSNDWLRQYQSMEATNPIRMTCNPYNTSNYLNCTDPPMQEKQVELWETAVCGHVYDMDSLDDYQCPTKYEMITYNSREELEEAGAQMTHWGACGACSTSKDFGVYLEYPDLTAKGQECSIRGVEQFGGSFAQGVECFQEVGYTYACAEMWMYNVLNTRDNCFDVCVDFTFTGDGANNGPAPECKIADCLLCDEQMSGPYFQTVAARSRRRSGLLSKIVRPCEVILIVDHEPPCNTTRKKLVGQNRGLQSSQRITAPPKWTAPEPTETCIFIEDDLGLTSHEGKDTNEWLIPSWLLSQERQKQESQYDSCFAYNFNGVISGYWRNQRDIFGPAYNTAITFGSLGLILGIITVVCLWCSMCIASGKRFWSWMCFFLALCGVFMILTLTFFASDVCEGGCKAGSAAVMAIVSGILFWAAAFWARLSTGINPRLPTANCCCCPTVKTARYASVPDRDTIEVEITETENDDGEIVIKKLTKTPDGRIVVERTTKKRLSKETKEESREQTDH